jgi:hypothetical protein
MQLPPPTKDRWGTAEIFRPNCVLPTCAQQKKQSSVVFGPPLFGSTPWTQHTTAYLGAQMLADLPEPISGESTCQLFPTRLFVISATYSFFSRVLFTCAIPTA